MKVYSPEITHKQEVGGVRLDIGSPQEIKTAYNEILAEVAAARPDATVHGIVVQPMVRRTDASELMLGVTRDALFGPVLSLGAGGSQRNRIAEHVVTLPPLNRFLVGRFVARSPVSRLVGAAEGDDGEPHKALEEVLLRVSEMACELPTLLEMDINPLLAGADGVIALDARIVVTHSPPNLPRSAHMSRHWQTADGVNVLIRPVRPEDAVLEKTFVGRLSEQTRYYRFFGALRDMTPSMLVRFTQFDYDRELALAAIITEHDEEIEIGVVRYFADDDGDGCEFAVVVTDAWQGKGLGRRLMSAIIAAARDKGLRRMHGEVLAENSAMLAMMTSIGFGVATGEDDASIRVVSIDL